MECSAALPLSFVRTCSNTLQSWDAALGLATFQELVMGDAALPIGAEDGAQMMLIESCRSWGFVICNRPEIGTVKGRIS